MFLLWSEEPLDACRLEWMMEEIINVDEPIVCLRDVGWLRLSSS
jgi:hypothetical protein